MRRAVERRVAAARARVAERVRLALPDAQVEEDARGVTVAARALVRRWIADARLTGGWRA